MGLFPAPAVAARVADVDRAGEDPGAVFEFHEPVPAPFQFGHG